MDAPAITRPDPPSAPSHATGKDHPSIWSGFYKKALAERQHQLRLTYPNLFASSPSVQPSPPPHDTSFEDTADVSGPAKFPINGLDEGIADHMVENCIGTIGLPVGLALNFIIDDVPVVVPMAVEEPSIIAAVSGAAKTLCAGGGFRTESPTRNLITAQILLLDVPDHRLDRVADVISSHKQDLLVTANQFCQSMHQRGGGAIDLAVRKVKRSIDPLDRTTSDFLTHHLHPTATESGPQDFTPSSYWVVVHIDIDVCDAMGANCASTVAEGMSPALVDLAGPGTRLGLRIVSNLNPSRVSKASFKVPVHVLLYKGVHGSNVAARIIEAYQWACDDVFRATTHNKGIMNGIDAVAVATGQDWRAVESACHSWAAFACPYSSMTRYWIERDHDGYYLCGELGLPVTVGTKGGVLATSSVYYYTLGLMGFPDAKRLACIMCSVGLAQNFAALRALCTEGIQRSHMHLHARNLVIAAGAPAHAIPEISAWMIAKNRISVDAALEYVTAHQMFTRLHHRAVHDPRGMKPPSMFYFAEARDMPLTLNIAFQTLGSHPVYLDFTDCVQESPVHAILLGGKTYDWLMQVFPLVDLIQMPLGIEVSPSTDQVIRRLKTISLVLNVLIRRLMLWWPEQTRAFVDRIFARTLATKPIHPPNYPAALHSSTNQPRPSVARYIRGLLDQAAHSENVCLSNDSSANSKPNISELAVPITCRSLADWRTPVVIDWVLPESGIFCTDLFDDDFHLTDLPSLSEKDTPCTLGTDAMPSPREILQVGLPLILSVWQVFEVWVTQHVGRGSPLLSTAIHEELRLIVSTLVSTPNDIVTQETLELVPYFYTPPDETLPKSLTEQDAQKMFSSALKVQAKRSQCTLFLLIDLMVVNPQHISASTITAIKSAGWALEHQASVVHDVARLARDFRAVFDVSDVVHSDTFPSLFAQGPVRKIRRLSSTGRSSHRGSTFEPLALHTDSVRNSVLTYAGLQVHIHGTPLTYQSIEALLPQYLAAVNNSGFVCTMKQLVAVSAMDLDLVSEAATHLVAAAVASGYLEKATTALRHKLGVHDILGRAESIMKK